MTTTTPAALDEVKRLMQEGRFDAALTALSPALADNPDDQDALYMGAVCHRYLGQAERAEAQIQVLLRLAPEFGRAYQELGHIARGRADWTAARAAYQAAVHFNPGLPASWDALSEAHEHLGETQEAAKASAQAERLKGLPPELISVTSFIHEGKLLKAERLCRSFLQRNPRHVEGMRLLADLGVRFQVYDDADFLLETALELEPENVLVRMDYVNVLHKRQQYTKALEQAADLCRRQPDNPAFQVLFANESAAIGDFDTALDGYQQVIDTHPDNPAVHLAQGHAFKTVGQSENAIDAYRAAYSVKPDFGEAFWSLANLKTYRFTEDEVHRMQDAAAAETTGLSDRIHLNFALGKSFEDQGQIDASFKHYADGNALKKAQLRYDPDHMDRELKSQSENCTAELFQRKKGHGLTAPDPIFIVGLPRAGSTLLEQILASHSQVDGTIELPNVLATAHRLNGRRRLDEDAVYPKVLHELTSDQLSKLGQQYIDDTRIYRKGAPFFTDKMPNNFRHIGLIHLMLPNAKIIDARRNAMDCCFSGFKQLFAEGQEFTYGLEDVGRYYKGYVELMDHWDSILPGKILRVTYEDVVADLETQVHRVLDHLGISFEPACVEFHKTDRAVQTASAEQVRQPLYASGIGQWTPFEAHLKPLKDTLGPDLL